MMNKPISLSQINVFPVKSIAGVSQQTAYVEKQGLHFDRRFMVATPDGKMVTARTSPEMLKVTASLQVDGLILHHPDRNDLSLKLEQLEMKRVTAQVWSDTFSAYNTTEEANQWFSSILAMPVQLLYTGKQSHRLREKIQTNVSFADGYPLLIISQGSLNALNQRSTAQHSMSQFRTNLVIDSDTPFIEDSWRRIRIGEVEFEIIKPCQRCILTTVDPNSTEYHPDKEPLATLSSFRADQEGKVFFGQNLIAKNEGTIHLGDTIKVIETKEKECYQEKKKNRQGSMVKQQKPTKQITISLNGHLFQGNTKDPLLNQAEKAGLNINYSCRAGLCGACRVTLESGEVEQEESPALNDSLKKHNVILACCSVPKTDVEIVD